MAKRKSTLMNKSINKMFQTPNTEFSHIHLICMFIWFVIKIPLARSFELGSFHFRCHRAKLYYYDSTANLFLSHKNVRACVSPVVLLWRFVGFFLLLDLYIFYFIEIFFYISNLWHHMITIETTRIISL